jgi:hypothetical protein
MFTIVDQQLSRQVRLGTVSQMLSAPCEIFQRKWHIISRVCQHLIKYIMCRRRRRNRRRQRDSSSDVCWSVIPAARDRIYSKLRACWYLQTYQKIANNNFRPFFVIPSVFSLLLLVRYWKIVDICKWSICALFLNGDDLLPYWFWSNKI